LFQLYNCKEIKDDDDDGGGGGGGDDDDDDDDANLLGSRPCDLFWSHKQSRRLLRTRPWLYFPHGKKQSLYRPGLALSVPGG